VEAVRIAVTAAGAGEDCDIDIPGFAGPTVPTEALVAVTVSQLDFDANTGRFTASLAITGEAMNAIDMRISGRVEEMVTAPVSVARLLAETVLREEDVRMTRVRASQVTTEVARSPEQVVGMQLRRPVPGGQVLRVSDLVRPPLVQRGALVRMQLQVGGITVDGKATALDAGAAGEQIRVQNTNSHTLVTATVTGPDQVRVDPGGSATATVRASRQVQRP
jgi:flagella basal body P-ring formation protein FlgA